MFRLLRFLPSRWWSLQGWRDWSRYIHWRLETFGVYQKNGQKDSSALRQMLRQLRGYLKWLKEMDEISKTQSS